MSAMSITEHVARAICKARGQNPDECMMGSAGVGTRDGKPFYDYHCYRRAWQENMGMATVIISAVDEFRARAAGIEVKEIGNG